MQLAPDNHHKLRTYVTVKCEKKTGRRMELEGSYNEINKNLLVMTALTGAMLLLLMRFVGCLLNVPATC